MRMEMDKNDALVASGMVSSAVLASLIHDAGREGCAIGGRGARYL